MKKSKFAEEKITFALKQAERGTTVVEVCRERGASGSTFNDWKKIMAVLAYPGHAVSSSSKRRIRV